MKMHWHRMMAMMFAFRAPEGDGGGGGGGKEKDPPADPPKYVDVDQLNGALKGQRDRITKDVTKAIGEQVASQIAALEGKLADMKAEGAKPAEQDPVKQELAAMKKKLDDAEKRAQA